MKKVLSALLAIAAICSLALCVNAAGIEKWTVVTLESAQEKPAVAETAEGLLVNLAKYHFKGEETGGDPLCCGLVYNDKITLDGFKVEIEMKNAPTSGDAWLGINFVSKPTPFDPASAEKTEGFVSLLRPINDGGGINFEGYQHTTQTVFKQLGTIPIEVADYTKANIVFEAKKTDEGYKFYLNGNEHPGTYDQLLTLFADGKCYLQISAHYADAHAYEYVIKSINGQPVVTANADPGTVDQETTSPPTGDIALIWTFAAVLSAGAFLVLRKKISVK